jgi:hypothetical protein
LDRKLHGNKAAGNVLVADADLRVRYDRLN